MVNGQVLPVTSGQVNVVLWLAERPDEQFLCSGSVGVSGQFFAQTPPEIMAAFGRAEIIGEALYLGTWFWSPCRSETRQLA